MKRSLVIISCLIIIISSVVAAEKEDAGLLFVKTLIEKAGSENGYVNALRYFQYTATTAKNNPSSYVLSKWGKEAMDESGLKPSDKGKYISVLSSRKSARIEKLWKENKEELLNLFPAQIYNEILKDEIDSLISFRSSPEYAAMMKKMKAKSKRPGVKTIDHAGAVTGWSGYKQLAFWYRRDFEKNDKVVFEILKELKAYYSQQ
ncbi:MAG: hypothetical protein CVV49_20835 [Spirochaetae bacterium HGW-Spirochaetae-5]|nr:MAG: hypothetical protein CVV49_20835 [Spirochaetae bacterium HGW-Spirochaetae-5]